MKNLINLSGRRWFAVQTLSNQEIKVKKFLEKFIALEEVNGYVHEVIMPTETVTEIRSGKKFQKVRKFYPGYVFVHMNLYDENSQILQQPWYFIRSTKGVIGFVGGDHPFPLKEKEINRILAQMKEAEGRETPKVTYEVGDEVNINDGPFLNLTGRIDEIDAARGKLKISVSIFGRFTPVELEYWQVKRVGEN